jgi:hypothetical protein
MNNAIINKLIRYALGLLQIFVGITAVLGGFGLVSDPSGTKMNVPLELLKNTPFTNYLIPGLVLLIVIGVGNVFAGIVTFLRHRYAGSISVFFGAVLAFYMITEVWLIGLVNFSQPLYFVLGAVELIFGLNLSRADKSEHQIWIQSKGSKLKA